MIFTSYEFIAFVGVLLLLYYILPHKFQWPLLLVFSYAFYLISSPTGLIYMLVTTVTIYFAAYLIGRNYETQKSYLKENKNNISSEEKKKYKASQKGLRKKYLVICIVINVGILAVVKYADFILGNTLSGLHISFENLIIPMGISFYTFQSLSYLIDVYWGTVEAQKNPFKLALFVSFFPLIVQGPISRYGDMSKTMYERHKFDSKVVSYGLERILWGFFKKLVVADRILAGVTTIISDFDKYNGAYSFIGMIFYTIELYADFTGGIDITIGVAEALGITVSENFNRPYFSKSLKEYWRRWHISMCNWFRDYIFYPVSSSKWLQSFSKFSRKHFGQSIGKRLPVYVASFIVWFTTGIWHGASWNFIVWGLANWAVLMISEECEPLYNKFHSAFNVKDKKLYRIFEIARTFILICSLNMFDCYSSVRETIRSFVSMFTASNWKIILNGELLNIGLTYTDYLILLFGVIVMLLVSLIQRSGSVRDKILARPYPVRFVLWFGLFLCVVLFGAYGVGYDSSQFIYNRF
jgi:D-alanyl-lipoteichoic acid acyltransferase DltB (MBOAT superfamily)